jgi:hypothetical protein
MSNQFILCGPKRNYYVYDDELYTKTFPMEWAEDHIPGTGPKDCIECKKNGFWNGVFIGYCVPCSEQYKSHYEGGQTNDQNLGRGNGFVNSYETSDGPASATRTYLSNIEREDVGDTDLFDSAANQDNVLSTFDNYPWLLEHIMVEPAKFGDQFSRAMSIIVLLRHMIGLKNDENEVYVNYIKNPNPISDKLETVSFDEKINLLVSTVKMLKLIIVEQNLELEAGIVETIVNAVDKYQMP